VAAARGARVVATDWAEEALVLLRTNAERNGIALETRRARWDEPELLAGRWDLVLAADVLYERRNVDQLVPLLARLSREVWFADPGRVLLPDFLAEMEPAWEHTATQDPVTPSVHVHRFRRRS
jgi:predicted nicotinamide N-methyase